MTYRRNSGFVMLIAIMLIALTAAALTLIAAGTRQLSTAAQSEYGEAVSRNLLGSGLAWARLNLAGLTEPAKLGEISLDTAPLDQPERTIHISVASQSPDDLTAEITGSYVRGRTTRTKSLRYVLRTAGSDTIHPSGQSD